MLNEKVDVLNILKTWNTTFTKYQVKGLRIFFLTERIKNNLELGNWTNKRIKIKATEKYT